MSSPWRFFRDCSERVIDKELTFGIAVPWFNPDLLAPVEFQVRSGHWHMTSYVNLCTAKNWHDFAALSRPRLCRRKMKLSRPSKPPRNNIFHISDFSLESPGVRSVMWPPHYKSMGKYRNWLFCYENDILRSQACTILFLTVHFIPQFLMFA